jgi:hypothetical protein
MVELNPTLPVGNERNAKAKDQKEKDDVRDLRDIIQDEGLTPSPETLEKPFARRISAKTAARAAEVRRGELTEDFGKSAPFL